MEKRKYNFYMNKYKALRIKAGYKTSIAAKLLGIKMDTLYKIENGRRNPSPILKIKMAYLYGCDLAEL